MQVRGSVAVWARAPPVRWDRPAFPKAANCDRVPYGMCRLFGFRSVIPSQVHRSLVAAENALSVQSHKHPDGWGVAYYVDGCPHLTRSAAAALGDSLFHRLSGAVASETVLAHVRQATQGKSSVLNSHPFQYGRWVGAHNGDIPNLDAVRPALRAEISPALLRFVLGDTDSELIFFQFLSRLGELGPLGRPHVLADVVRALRQTVKRTREIDLRHRRPPRLAHPAHHRRADARCLPRRQTALLLDLQAALR